jgi:hypothetical protein
VKSKDLHTTRGKEEKEKMMEIGVDREGPGWLGVWHGIILGCKVDLGFHVSILVSRIQ